MRESYAEAVEHIRYNTALLRPGLHMEDLTRSLHVLQDKYDALKYSSPMHGVGMCDEWPLIAYPDRLVHGAFDAILEPGLTLCVEALVGEVGGDHTWSSWKIRASLRMMALKRCRSIRGTHVCFPGS